MILLSEARMALRPWRRRPLVALSAAVCLAFGLAAAIAVFAVTDAVLWRQLPLPSADRLVWITSADRGIPDGTSPGVFSTWAARTRTLAAVGALRPAHAVLKDVPPGDRLAGVYASSGAFTVLGVPAALGRTLSAQDDQPGAPPVLMISHRVWQSRFAGSADVLGRAVQLDGKTRLIVGVMPAAIDALPFGFDWWAPLALSAAQAANVGPRYLDVLGRRGGGDAAGVEQELTALSAAAGARGDTGLPLATRVESLQQHLTGEARPLLLPLLGAVLAVVLLASVNAANLLLANGHGRRAEIALRASLGASRGRIIRQLLLESAWLTVAAGTGAIVLSLWMIDSLKALLPLDPAVLGAVRLDLRVILFASVLVTIVTALSGLLPAFRNSGLALREGLASGRAVSAGHDRLRRAFVVLQVGLALAIGTAGALMGRSTMALGAVPRGYDEQVLTAALQLSTADYPDAARIRGAVGRVVEAAAALPGAAGVAIATRVPLSGGTPGSDVALTSETFTPDVDRQVRVRFVTPGYFAAVGTPLREGRDVARADDDRGALVVMVNEALARRLAGRGSVVGREVKFAVKDFNVRGPDTPWQVVGVVADARDGGPRAAVHPEVYLPIAQGPAEVFEWIGRQVLLTVRSQQGRVVQAAAVRQAVADVEPALAVFDVLTLRDRLRRHLSPERVMAGVLVPLGVAAMGLSAFGLFTLLLQFVASRRRELAIRISLGATSRRVVTALVREGLTLTAFGIVLGLAGAAIAGRALRALMFGVTPFDPAILASMVALTLATTLAAVWLPARRAAAVDPAVLLRNE